MSSWVLRERLDVWATQEATPDMVQDLAADLADYQALGEPRSADPMVGEMAALFVNRKRFRVLRTATFWLSETPDTFASIGWDAALPRVCTWAQLEDLASGQVVYVFNTHYDHKGVQARLASSQLIEAQIRRIAGDAPVWLLGDFNLNETAEALQPLSRVFKNSREASLTPPQGGQLTFVFGTHIDHIFVSQDQSVQSYATQLPLASRWRMVSDHFPVLVEVR